MTTMLVRWYLLGFSLMFCSWTASAQSSNDLGLGEMTHPNSPFNVMNSVSLQKFQESLSQTYSESALQYNEYNGSPYLYDDFAKGYVVFNDGEKIDDIDLNYDVYSSNILAVNKQGSTIALDQRFYSEIGFYPGDDAKQIFKKIKEFNSHDFYEILHESQKIGLYKEYGGTIRPPQQKGVAVVPGRIIVNKKYYIRTGAGKHPVDFKLNKKSLFSHLSENQKKDIEKYIKRNKLKMKKESEFVDVLRQLVTDPIE